MKNKNSSCILLIFAFIVCIGILGVAIYMAVEFLPNAAASDFGLPREGLPTIKHLQLSTLLILNRDGLLTPQWFGGETETFLISAGEGASNVAFNLRYQGVIPDAEAFTNYLIYKGYDVALQQGEFTIEPGLTPVEIADVLLRQEIGITILPGYRLEEIAEIVTSSTGIPTGEFLEIARHPTQYAIISTLPIEGGLEGLLFPQTYPISDENNNANELITIMLREMEKVITADIVGQFQAHGLTVKEGITLASMIERENHINIPNEMEQMASVYLNRLSIDMLFQSDPTVQYGLRNLTSNGEWWPSITVNDYANVDSPYNTYLYNGFPPGPICMPSQEAILAVAYPVETQFLYFRSCPDENFHRFSITHEEHLDACP